MASSEKPIHLHLFQWQTRWNATSGRVEIYLRRLQRRYHHPSLLRRSRFTLARRARRSRPTTSVPTDHSVIRDSRPRCRSRTRSRRWLRMRGRRGSRRRSRCGCSSRCNCSCWGCSRGCGRCSCSRSGRCWSGCTAAGWKHADIVNVFFVLPAVGIKIESC
jgi:hypothetical protein